MFIKVRWLREKVGGFLSFYAIQAILIAASFIFLFWYRTYSKVFGTSLEYFTVIVIVLGGYWFGRRGGIVVGSIAIAELIFAWFMFPKYTNHALTWTGVCVRFAAYLFCGVVLGFLSDERKRLNKQLMQFSEYDELTGCVNPRLLMQLLEREAARAVRFQKDLTLVRVDLDHFKYINDTYGYSAGNEVLKAFSRTLCKGLRTIDIAGRCGSDDFLLILSEATPQQARKVLERVRDSMRQTEILLPQMVKDAERVYTFSAGIAALPYNAESLPILLKVVEGTLNEAKRQGRNRILVERRRWYRFSPPPGFEASIVGCSQGESRIAVRCINLSLRGIFFSCADDLSEEDFMIRLYFPDKKASFEYKCRTLHKKKASEQEYSIGGFFTVIPL